MIARKRVVVDVENGVVLWPNGKPIHARPNFWGYMRFQVRVRRRDGRRVANWFFVHKAVMLAEGLKLKKHYEINHKDEDRSNNRRKNLEYIHRRENLALSRKEPEVNPAF
jgi:hypothetical protein